MRAWLQGEVPRSSVATERSPRWGRLDWLLATLVALMTAAYHGAHVLTYQATFLRWPALNFWFDGDPPIIARAMTDPAFQSDLTWHHPIFLLATHGPRWILGTVTGLWDFESVAMFCVFGAAGLTVLAYVLLRGLDLTRVESLAFTTLVGVSAAAVFWFPVPELAVSGGVTVTAAFAAAAWWERGAQLRGVATVAGAATLVFTTTNFMGGVLALLVRFRVMSAAIRGLLGLAGVAVLALVQARIFEGAPLFLQPRGNEAFIFHPDVGGFLEVIRAGGLHAVVMPAFEVAARESVRIVGHLSVQQVAAGHGGALVAIGGGLWLAIAGGGVTWLAAHRGASRTGVAMALFLAGQLVLHRAYGVETFLYAAHWVVPLVAVAALGVRHAGRYGRAILVMTGLAVGVVGVNNHRQFGRAAALMIDNDIRYAPPR